MATFAGSPRPIGPNRAIALLGVTSVMLPAVLSAIYMPVLGLTATRPPALILLIVNCLLIIGLVVIGFILIGMVTVSMYMTIGR